MPRGVQVYATTPQSEPMNGFDGATAPSGKEYVRQVVECAQWAEAHGCTGSLIYTNNTLVDGWHVAQLILENTGHLRPFVAVEPTLMSPYAVAKKLSTLAHLFGRTVDINMVAGGFKGHLKSRNDETPHDRRYERATEYAMVIQRLLGSRKPMSFDGEFYHCDKLKLIPPMPAEHCPLVTVAGSSEAGRETARRLGATPIHYPLPIEEYSGGRLSEDGNCGARIGIIARPDAGEAQRIANERFPLTKKGHRMHVLASQVSDASWHEQLRSVDEEVKGRQRVYWLRPFETYKTFCPYYVGSYDDVAAELAGMINLGVLLFVLDIFETREDYVHTEEVFTRAKLLAARRGVAT